MTEAKLILSRDDLQKLLEDAYLCGLQAGHEATVEGYWVEDNIDAAAETAEEILNSVV